IRQAREFRVQAAVRMLTEVAETLRSLLGDRLAKARAEYHAEKARHDQIVQAQERLREARADLESEIGRLSLYTPIDYVLEPVHEWLGRLQVPQTAVEPALRTVQSRLSEAPESYRVHVGQSLAALGSKHADLSGLRLATLNLPPVAPPAAPPWPTVTMETRAAFGLIKQKTVMVLMPQLQEALEATVRAAVAPLQAQVTFQLSEWARRVLDARLASWMQTLPDAAARVAAAARPVEQLVAVSSYWEPLGRSAQQAAATAPPRQMPTATAMGDLVGQFRELALPRLLLRAIHDVSGTGRTGRRRVLLIGKRFDRPWQLVQLLLREQQRDALAPPTGLLWLRTPDRHTSPPFPCDSCPHPEHRLLSRIDLVVAAENADPVELSAAAHWADAVIVAAPASETAEARWAAKEILVLGEAGTQADRLPELMATLAGRRVILHDGHDVRFTHLLSLLGRAETPANLVRLWRAWRLRQGSPFDPADLQGYFAEIQAGRSGDRA
ncbi:MAG TPA: hypothetical protein VNT75_12755, partial [Symbiobacteriaceae bacterium]|nr:hypothetical protein [Symbiobacteriaceae bacterium]